MKRFFGMMPNSCVEIHKSFRDSNDLRVEIEAGPVGWTIIWADGGTYYEDKNDTSENNFRKAYGIAVDAVGPLREVKR